MPWTICCGFLLFADSRIMTQVFAKHFIDLACPVKDHEMATFGDGDRWAGQFIREYIVCCTVDMDEFRKRVIGFPTDDGFHSPFDKGGIHIPGHLLDDRFIFR